MKKLIQIILLLFTCNQSNGQAWIVRDSIIVFPDGFYSWLKRNNGGIDTSAPSNVGQFLNKKIGTNQGIDVFDFNKDGLMDLTFQLFPSNTITREFLKGIFINNGKGNYVLDTNYVIKGKGDMWYGGFADFNGDNLIDYYYITQNYHGADSNRIYNTEMIYDNWPERIFINNGKSFDTLSLDLNNIRIKSAYTSDIDGDGKDEIICTSGENLKYIAETKSWYNSRICIYKYNKSQNKFEETLSDIPILWNQYVNQNISGDPIINIIDVNDSSGFWVLALDSLIGGVSIWDYTKFTLANYNFKSKKFNFYSIKRDSILIPEKFSKSGADVSLNGGDDYFKFLTHNLTYVNKIDLDKNGEMEIVVGGFYQNNHRLNKQKYAYGWKVFSLNGQDLTSKYFENIGIDRGVDLISHGLDIDENSEGIEFIPGVWGIDRKYYIDGSATLGYYYKLNKGKFDKTIINDIRHFTGRKLDSTYLKEMQIVKFPNYIVNKNALLLFDFWDIKRTAIIYQASCKGIVKPTFSNTKFSFCTNDSLKLTINNVNKGDTLKWYFGTKSDLTNVTNKTFTDSTKLYVTRTDSVGCVISSDTIQLSKIAKPSSPNLSRDTENNLVANINGITWYKDGVKITDTTQKIKPSSNGNYTATTTQNGCTSPASANYYFLTSAVTNLSSDEYFKVSPNPTDGEIYLNYNIRSTRDVFISVIDMSGRTIISNRKVNSGNKLNLGTTMKGNYIIQVKDKSGRLLTTEKLIKN
jgi:hypothetical protein